MQEKLSVMQCHSPHSSLERPLLALLATAGLAYWWPGGLGQSLSEEEAGDRFCDSQLPGAVVRPGARGLGLCCCLKGLGSFDGFPDWTLPEELGPRPGGEKT